MPTNGLSDLARSTARNRPISSVRPHIDNREIAQFATKGIPFRRRGALLAAVAGVALRTLLLFRRRRLRRRLGLHAFRLVRLHRRRGGLGGRRRRGAGGLGLRRVGLFFFLRWRAELLFLIADE